MWKPLRTFALCGLLLGVVGFPFTADAAEFTDVLDAADDKDDYLEETFDPFDFSLEPSFSYETGKAQITREAPCVKEDEGSYSSDFQNDIAKTNPRVQFGDCTETTINEYKEVLYRHREARLDIDARIGLYKDLELHFNAPIVFSETNAMKYANEADDASDNVSASNSWVDPSDGRIKNGTNGRGGADEVFSGSSPDSAPGRLNRFKSHSYFDLTGNFEDNEYQRAGFDDPSVGIAWGAFNDHRDNTKATMLLGMDYVIPVAPIRQGDNEAVGDGMHKLQWTFGTSKQFDWVDPYFALQYMLQIPVRGSPIKELKEIDPDNGGQAVTQPPHKGNISLGTEFIPYEERTQDDHVRYAIDLNFTFGYTSEGRDYSPLYDHMVNSKCNNRKFRDVLPEYDSSGNYVGPGGVECSWMAQRPANVRGRDRPTYNLGAIDEDQTLRTNGIMTVEAHARFSGHVGLYLQPTKYFQLKLRGGITHQQEHFLTNARTGSDISDGDEATNDNKVDLTGSDAKKERNPAYNSTYDSPGGRFRINRYNTWSFLATAAIQF